MALLRNPQELLSLKLELAAVVDIGSHFVRATYNFEGDGALSVGCYEEILKIRYAINAKHYPNIQAVTREACPGNATLQQQLLDLAISRVQPGLDYFNSKFGDDTKHPMSAFKAVRLLSPTLVTQIQPTAPDIDQLKVLPFLPATVLEAFERRASNLPSKSVCCGFI